MKTNHTRDEDRLQSKPLDAETVYWWITHANSKEDAIDYLTTTLTQYHQDLMSEVVKDILKMADALEMECGKDGDKGTKQWMAFKGFRNTIRDKYIIKLSK